MILYSQEKFTAPDTRGISAIYHSVFVSENADKLQNYVGKTQNWAAAFKGSTVFDFRGCSPCLIHPHGHTPDHKNAAWHCVLLHNLDQPWRGSKKLKKKKRKKKKREREEVEERKKKQININPCHVVHSVHHLHVTFWDYYFKCFFFFLCGLGFTGLF